MPGDAQNRRVRPVNRKKSPMRTAGGAMPEPALGALRRSRVSVPNQRSRAEVDSEVRAGEGWSVDFGEAIEPCRLGHAGGALQ